MLIADPHVLHTEVAYSPCAYLRQSLLKLQLESRQRKLKQYWGRFQVYLVLQFPVASSLQAASSARATRNRFFPPPPSLRRRRHSGLASSSQRCCWQVRGMKPLSPCCGGMALEPHSPAAPAKHCLPKATSAESGGRVEVIRKANSDLLVDRAALKLPSFPCLLPTQYTASAEVYVQLPICSACLQRSQLQDCGGARILPAQKPARDGGRLRPFSQTRHLEFA